MGDISQRVGEVVFGMAIIQASIKSYRSMSDAKQTYGANPVSFAIFRNAGL
jgi:hypothetical protein